MTMPATMKLDVSSVPHSDIAGDSLTDAQGPSADHADRETPGGREDRPAGRAADDYLRIDVC